MLYNINKINWDTNLGVIQADAWKTNKDTSGHSRQYFFFFYETILDLKFNYQFI